MKLFKTGLTVAAIALFAPMALAADVALVITNPSDHQGRSQARAADAHTNLVEALDQNGYEVLHAQDPSRNRLINLIGELEDRLAEAERVVIAYGGDYFTTGGKTYLVPANLDPGSRTEGMTQAISFDLLFDLASRRPGASLMALGLSRQAVLPGDRRVPGARFDISHGVMVIRGGAPSVYGLLARDMLGERLSVGQIDPRAKRVSFEGLILPGFRIAEPPEVPAVEVEPAEVPEATTLAPGDFAEETLWALARNGENDVAYRLYLQRYPDGKYAEQARLALGLPAPGSQPSPQAIEQSLDLSRDARREVQSDLTALGFNTRGVDGIFGNGTRTALQNWQDENDFDRTGFLTADQVARIAAQADIRREELRVEAERLERERRRADQGFWRETGRSGREEDLRTYLNRYPDGLFAEEARAKLSEFDRLKEREEDNAAFAQAAERNSERSYLRYLRRYPEGIHVQEARNRINEIRRDNANLDDIEQHRDRERALGLNVASALVIEQRLRALGYQVGPVDGQLDTTTRDAISRFQTEQDITATGYLNTATIQRLILASNR